MNFEKNVPEWKAPGTEPPDSLKSSGFSTGYKPPAAYFNWFWTAVSECLTEIREKLKQVRKVEDGGTGKSAVTAGNMLVGNGSEALAEKTPEQVREHIKAAPKNAAIPVVAAHSTDGAAYTATVDGVTELVNGMLITIVPDVTSTLTAITLNVNNLGEKMVRLPLSFNNAAMTIPRLETYFTAGRPITLQYDAAYLNGDGIWKTFGKQRTSAQDLYGAVPVDSGGTGSTTPRGAQFALLNDMEDFSDPIHDAHQAVFRTSGPSETNGVLIYTKMSAVWEYIAGKIRSVFGFTSSNVLGVSSGGTGATTAEKACEALGAAKSVHNHGMLVRTSDKSGDLVAEFEDYNAGQLGWRVAGKYSSNDDTTVAFSLRLNKETGRLNARIDSKAGEKYPYFYTSLDKPSAEEIGALSASDLAATQANVLTPQIVTATTNILTLANGFYHHEGDISTTNNWPWDDADGRAEIIVQGHRVGSNGWWYIVAINYNTGSLYLNMHHWSYWSGWRQINMTKI